MWRSARGASTSPEPHAQAHPHALVDPPPQLGGSVRVAALDGVDKLLRRRVLVDPAERLHPLLEAEPVGLLAELRRQGVEQVALGHRRAAVALLLRGEVARPVVVEAALDEHLEERIGGEMALERGEQRVRVLRRDEAVDVRTRRLDHLAHCGHEAPPRQSDVGPLPYAGLASRALWRRARKPGVRPRPGS